MKVVITAGHHASRHSLALINELHLSGVRVAGILVVSAFSFSRVRREMRRKGFGSWSDFAMKYLLARSRQSRYEDEFYQNRRLKMQSLKRESVQRGIPLCTVKSLNSSKSLEFLRTVEADTVAYSGGGILRWPFIDAVGGRVFNAHSGQLPWIRGMNACEWSLLLGVGLGVSLHLIDKGIDTGRLLAFSPVERVQGDTVNDLRAKCTIAGVKSMAEVLSRSGTMVEDSPIEFPQGQAPPSASDFQCFALAPQLRDYLDGRLAGIYE
jgi:folate-dependent phosphoribosylglycinamide formyltransferase PurN